MGVESYLSFGSLETNAAILIASGSELMLIKSFEIARLDFPRDTLESIHCFLPNESLAPGLWQTTSMLCPSGPMTKAA